MKNIRAVFMGTSDFAVGVLKSIESLLDVVLVVTQPDKPVGRKHILTPTQVKQVANTLGIEVFTPSRIREDYERVIAAKPDIIITCAYGQIIPKEILDTPRLGCINVHASLLPSLRGGAPIQRAIMEGYTQTGITIMYMDEHMDSGDIISQKEIAINEDDTYESLSKKLMNLGCNLLVETLPSIVEGTNSRTKQDETEVTFAPIIKKEDELIDFNKTTRQIYDHIRGLYPAPCAYFTLMGKKIKVLSSRMSEKKGPVGCINSLYEDGFAVGTSDGEIVVTTLKLEGKNIMSAEDYLRGIDAKELLGVKVDDTVD